MYLSEYLKQCGATYIWDLSDEEFLFFCSKTECGEHEFNQSDLDLYLSQCGVDSVWGLSDEQLISYCIEGHCGHGNKRAVMDMKHGVLNIYPDRKGSLKMLRSAIEQCKTLQFDYIMAEGIIDEEEGPSILGESRIETRVVNFH